MKPAIFSIAVILIVAAFFIERWTATTPAQLPPPPAASKPVTLAPPSRVGGLPSAESLVSDMPQEFQPPLRGVWNPSAITDDNRKIVVDATAIVAELTDPVRRKWFEATPDSSPDTRYRAAGAFALASRLLALEALVAIEAGDPKRAARAYVALAAMHGEIAQLAIPVVQLYSMDVSDELAYVGQQLKARRAELKQP